MIDKRIVNIFPFLFLLCFLISPALGRTINQGGRIQVIHDAPSFSLSIPGNLKEMSASMRPKNTLYLFAKPTRSFNDPSLTINIKKPRQKKEKKNKEKAPKEDVQNFGYQDPKPGRSIRTIKFKDRVLAIEENDIVVNNAAVVRYTATIPLKTQPIEIVVSGSANDKTRTFDILKKILSSFESPELIPASLKLEDK